MRAGQQRRVGWAKGRKKGPSVQAATWRRQLFKGLKSRKGGVTELPCFWCDTPLTWYEATTDHVVAQEMGGPDAEWNYAISCTPCQQSRAYISSLHAMMRRVDSRWLPRKPWHFMARMTGFCELLESALAVYADRLEDGCWGLVECRREVEEVADWLSKIYDRLAAMGYCEPEEGEA